MNKDNIPENKMLDESELVSILEIYFGRIDTINNLFSNYMTVFLSGIFVVLGACVLGITSNLSLTAETILICSGCLIAMVLAIGLKNMTKRNVEKSLENIAKVSIIEEKLALNDESLYSNDYWKNDSLIIKKHLESRKKSNSIKEFIEDNIEEGQYKNVKFIANSILYLSAFAFLVELSRAAYAFIMYIAVT